MYRKFSTHKHQILHCRWQVWLKRYWNCSLSHQGHVILLRYKTIAGKAISHVNRGYYGTETHHYIVPNICPIEGVCCRLYQWKHICKKDVCGSTNNGNGRATIRLRQRGKLKRWNKIKRKRNGQYLQEYFFFLFVFGYLHLLGKIEWIQYRYDIW